MSEIRELSDPKLQAPRDALELSSFVGGYSCLVDCLIGSGHAAAARLRDHAAFWQEYAPSLASMVGPENLAGFLMRIMRSIQLATVGYFNAALRLGPAARLPDYGRIEDAVKDRTLHNLSHLPAHYLSESAVTPLPPRAAPAASHSAPAPTSYTAPASSTSAPRMSVRVDATKAHQNPEWAAKFASSAKEIKDLKLDANRPKICLSYHLRGTCFESCREHPTHRALTTAEKTATQAFLDKAL